MSGFRVYRVKGLRGLGCRVKFSGKLFNNEGFGCYCLRTLNPKPKPSNYPKP